MWTRKFEDPISLPGRKPLLTLRDAANYVMKLPKGEQVKPHWQTAAKMLMRAAEGQGPLMFARIAVLQALHHGQPPPMPRKKAVKTSHRALTSRRLSIR